MRVYGELFKAQLENLSSVASAALVGRAWYRTDISGGAVQVGNGTLVKDFLLNDQRIIVGTSGTAANNARLYRSGAGQLALVVGSDTTAEGTLAPANLAQLALVLPTDTLTNITAYARKAGVLYYASDLGNAVCDDGTVIRPLTADPFNYFINGSLDIWQRGTSFAAIANGTYCADRFVWNNTSAAVHTVSRSTDVPTLTQSSYQSSYSILVDCTTADVAVAAGDLVDLQHHIEGYTWAQLKNRIVTLSFWVKATKTGIYCVSFLNNASDRSYVAEYTINTTATWERKTITLTLNPSGGTDNYLNGRGLNVAFTIMAGSTYQTTAGTWQTGNFLATSNQVNGCDSSANDFRLTQISLNVGGPPANFSRHRFNFLAELNSCRRYYEKSYDLGVDPGTVTNVGSNISVQCSTAVRIPINFRVSKAATPTIVAYGTATSTADRIRDESGGSDLTATYTGVGENGFVGIATAAGADRFMGMQWTASAEI